MNKEHYQKLKKELPKGVTLVAVSKTKPNEEILEAYDLGHLDFGENKVQDLVQKQEVLPKDIRWHFIGHIQTNKIKFVAPFVFLFHGVDSIKVLRNIEKEALKNKRKINILLQVKISDEESKFGFSASALMDLLSSEIYLSLKNVQIVGLMGMASNTDNQDQVKQEFESLKNLFDQAKDRYLNKSDYFKIVSMGMSGDYRLAIEAGSNMVRIGSYIFGQRHL